MFETTFISLQFTCVILKYALHDEFPIITEWLRIKQFKNENIRVRHIGRSDRLPKNVQEKIEVCASLCSCVKTKKDGK